MRVNFSLKEDKLMQWTNPLMRTITMTNTMMTNKITEDANNMAITKMISKTTRTIDTKPRARVRKKTTIKTCLWLIETLCPEETNQIQLTMRTEVPIGTKEEVTRDGTKASKTINSPWEMTMRRTMFLGKMQGAANNYRTKDQADNNTMRVINIETTSIWTY